MVVGGIQSCGRDRRSSLAGFVRAVAGGDLHLILSVQHFVLDLISFLGRRLYHYPLILVHMGRHEQSIAGPSRQKTEGKFLHARDIANALQDQNEASLTKSASNIPLARAWLTKSRSDIAAEPADCQV